MKCGFTLRARANREIQVSSSRVERFAVGITQFRENGNEQTGHRLTSRPRTVAGNAGNGLATTAGRTARARDFAMPKHSLFRAKGDARHLRSLVWLMLLYKLSWVVPSH